MNLEALQSAPIDPIMGLTEAYKADPHPDKINLGVGIYQDEAGRTPILDCVKEAEALLLKSEQTKKYAPISGHPGYGEAVRRIQLGPEAEDGRTATCHTPGGTGALRLGADFMRQAENAKTVWVSEPTWANHRGIFQAAGYEVKSYPYYHAESRGLDFQNMTEVLKEVPAGDAVLLHVCCHNPTGQDPSETEWQALADIARQAGWLPFFDFAYQGFKTDIETDRRPLEIFMSHGIPFLVAGSFSKNFGLYAERTGALSLFTPDADLTGRAFGHMKRAARTSYSNPPVHGGAIVQTVLESAELTERWIAELSVMRNRIAGMRRAFVDGMHRRTDAEDFSFLNHQYGMFSFSGLDDKQVAFLRKEKSIYVVQGGRINVAGIQPDNLDHLCDAVVEALSL